MIVFRQPLPCYYWSLLNICSWMSENMRSTIRSLQLMRGCSLCCQSKHKSRMIIARCTKVNSEISKTKMRLKFSHTPLCGAEVMKWLILSIADMQANRYQLHCMSACIPKSTFSIWIQAARRHGCCASSQRTSHIIWLIDSFTVILIISWF